MPFDGFTQTFGGLTVNPTSVAFAEYSISSNLVLMWPLEADSGANVVAAQNNISASVSDLLVAMPDATLATQGAGALFTNTGANTFTVVDTNGFTLAAIPSGTSWYLYLIDNTTPGGSWQVLQFGAGTSVANAASLAGAGLMAVLTRLNQNLPLVSLNANYSPAANDLATGLRNTGGSVIYTPASAVTLGNGWFVYVINNGGGAITWTPQGGQTVDGDPTKVLNPTESAIFFSDGANFWTLGYGRSIVTTVTSAAINVAGGPSTITLNANQLAAQVQNYTGALTGDITVNYGTGPGFWFVQNNTTGAYNLILRVNATDAGVIIPQGTFSVVRSDGSNLSVALSTTTGTVTSVGTTAGELVGGPITTAGTIGLANTAVTPATYGDGANVPQIIVDAKGRITGASVVAISIPVTQVQTMTSAALRGRISDPTGTGAAVFADSPALTGSPTAPTQAPGDSSTKIATDAFVAAALAAALPPATIWQFAGSAAPTGWLLCDGSAVSRTTFANLFAVIGTTYGAGDGSTTFNLPDSRGRVSAGAGTGPGLSPRSRGDMVGTETHGHTASSGPESADTSFGSGGGSGVTLPAQGHTHAISVAAGSSMQPTFVVNYIIKT